MAVGTVAHHPFRVVSDFEPAGDQPTGGRQADRGSAARRPIPDAARHHRLRQERDRRVDHRAGAAADADPRPEQVARRAAGAGDARVLPAQPGRVLRQLLRLLPTRGVHPVVGHVHREGLVDQRRDRSPPPLGHCGAADASRRHRRRVGQLHLRHGQPGGVPGPAARAAHRRRLRPAQHPPPPRRPPVRPQRPHARAWQVPCPWRHDRDPPVVRGDGRAGRDVRRHGRPDHHDRHAHRRAALRDVARS